MESLLVKPPPLAPNGEARSYIKWLSHHGQKILHFGEAEDHHRDVPVKIPI